MGKRAKRVIACIAAGLVLLCVFGIIWAIKCAWPFIYTRDTDAEIGKLKAQGKPVCTQDLVPKKIPDSVNAALVYGKAFRAMPLKRGQMDVVYDFTSGDPAKAAKAKGSVSGLIARCSQSLKLTEKAAAMPQCQFAIPWGEGYLAELPHLNKLRQLSRLVAARALWSAQAGQMSACVHDVETGLEMSRATADEPILVSALVQHALVQIAAATLRKSVVYGHMPEAQARECHQKFGEVDLQTSLVKALEGERAMGLTLSRQMENGTVPDPEHPGKPLVSGPPAHLFRYMLRPDRRFYLRQFDMLLRYSGLPYREIKRKRLDQRMDADPPRYALVSYVLLPVGSRALEARDRCLVAVGQSRVACALEAYWDRFGSYPETLSELRSKLGWKIEEDPFSGRDFIYKRLPRGYLLYSIGDDLRDDGGETRDYFEKKELADRKKAHPKDWWRRRADENMRHRSDIVWRVKRG